MHKVLDSARQPAIRSVVVALALAGLLVFGGTALARLPGSHHGSVRPAATATTIKLLGKKALAMHPGQIKTLFKVGKITTRAVCINHGGGSFEAQIQIKSSTAGAAALGLNGAIALSATYQTILNVINAGPLGFANTFDVLIGTRTYYHFQGDVSVHGLGIDCGVRLAALSD